MIVNLWLGKKIEIKRQQIINVNEWELPAEKDFSFEYGVIYQFIDNSKEAAERRRQRANRFSV